MSKEEKNEWAGNPAQHLERRIQMEYNNRETIENFKSLMRIIAGDATEASKTADFEATTEELEALYRTCELIEGWAEQARISLGKLMDEREDTEWTQI
jgi:hypothetical protein